MAKRDEEEVEDNPEEEQGEIMDSGEVPDDVTDTDDGGAIVRIGEEEKETNEIREFYENIVEEFDQPTLEDLCTRLLDDIDRDKKSREKRDADYADAIKRTGLGKEAPGGADFEGASKVVHPMLTEACVDFAARAIRELMPPNGPVKTYVPGKEPSIERMEKADRKKEYMNWQFLVQMTDFRSELEQLLTQLPLGGSQYLRLVWDDKKRRPVPMFAAVDDVYLPYAASNFYTAERVTYVEHITKFEFEQRVKSGMYKDIGDVAVAQAPEQSKSARASDHVEGREEQVAYNEDGLRDEYEVSTNCELEDDYGSAPYRITIDSAARQIVAINRNWDEEDEEVKETMSWMVEFPFIPWRGAYSIGLGQMIGSLSGAATGALRALLDSAHVNNMPTLLRLKGANFSGQSKELQVGQVTEVEGGVASDDVRKLVMAVPYNEPSPVLFSLLGFLVDAGRGVVQTTFEKLADQNTNMPVGTTLALIEEGMKVMSGIHLRLYHAMGYVLRVLHRIDRMYLTDDEVKNDVGEVLAQRTDFELPLDVVPVADPEIFSDVQRLAQLQIVAERAVAMPQIYNLRKVEERILERTKIPNYEELLVPQLEPEDQNAVNENAAMTLGRPVAAFPDQDHLGHLQVHLDFLTSPVLGELPIIAPTFIPMCLGHLKEHMVLWYVNETFELMGRETGKNEDQLKKMLSFHDEETRKELDRFLAAASQHVIPEASQVFAKFPQIIQKAQQIAQQYQPQPNIPMDPNKKAEIDATMQIASQQAQMKQGDQQLKAQDLQARAQNQQATNQLKQADQQLKVVDMQGRQQLDAQRLQEQRVLKFMDLSAKEKQSAIDAANEAAQSSQEYAARLQELQQKERSDDERTAAELESREAMNTADNMTALKIAAAEIASGEKVAVSTGTGINPSGSQ